MKYILPIFVLTMAAIANASEAGGGHEGAIEVPVKLVTYQAINVVLMFAGLIYFLKDGVKKYFVEKRELFLASANKAEAARKSAEQEHMQIQVRLSQLESTADESVSRARAEAADMKKQLIAEAEALSKKIKEEAALAAKLEVEKAKRDLRASLVQDSIESARTNLNTKVSSDDQQRLQSNFISNIQAVQK